MHPPQGTTIHATKHLHALPTEPCNLGHRRLFSRIATVAPYCPTQQLFCSACGAPLGFAEGRVPRSSWYFSSTCRSEIGASLVQSNLACRLARVLALYHSLRVALLVHRNVLDHACCLLKNVLACRIVRSLHHSTTTARGCCVVTIPELHTHARACLCTALSMCLCTPMTAALRKMLALCSTHLPYHDFLHFSVQ